MKRTAAPSIHIRGWKPSDALGVREVLSATYGREATPASVYEWWSMGIASDPAGFMVAESAGQIVGVQPLQWFRYIDGHQQVRGGMFTGVAVHPDFRRLGIFTALVRAGEVEAWRNGMAFVTTMPNERSRPGFLKSGYVDLGRRTLLLRALQPDSVLRRRLPVTGALAGALLGVIQGITKPLRGRGGLVIRRIDGLPDGIEEVAARHAQLYSGLSMVRQREWWEWRYLRAPMNRYLFVEARELGGALAGFTVVARETRHAMEMAYLMDLAVMEREFLGGMLEGVFDVARSDGAEAMAAVCSAPLLLEDLRRQGFFRVPRWMPLKRFYSVVRFAPGTAVPKTWHTLAGWNQTLGDWDNL